MNILAALAVAAITASAVPPSGVDRAADAPAGGEVYVAQMDADWTVTREVRVPCDIDRGCTVDLGLTRDGAPAGSVHVAFDALRSGRVEVLSVVADAAGHAVPQPTQTIGIDQTGFGAVHIEATPAKSAAAAEGPPVILMAIKVPSWAAPLHPVRAPEGDPV